MEDKVLPHEDKFGPRKLEKQLFMEWLAMPSKLRSPTDQKGFSNKYDVSEQTLCAWKNEEGFLDEVRMYRKRRYSEKMSDVMEAVYKRAKSKGDSKDARFLAEYSEGFAEKKDITVGGDLASLLKEVKDEKLVNDDGTGN